MVINKNIPFNDMKDYTTMKSFCSTFILSKHHKLDAYLFATNTRITNVTKPAYMPFF